MHITLDDILDRFRGCYDIQRYDESLSTDDISLDCLPKSVQFKAFAECHVSGQQYFLLKKATIWQFGVHDYGYFFEAATFSASECDSCVRYAFSDALKRIVPSTEHKCSTVTVILLTETDCSSECQTFIRKYRKHKDFLFSWHGWVDVRIVMLNAVSAAVLTNRAGRDLIKIFDWTTRSEL